LEYILAEPLREELDRWKGRGEFPEIDLDTILF